MDRPKINLGYRHRLFFDTETSGLDPRTCEIIELSLLIEEVGADPYEPGIITDLYTTKIKPTKPVPEEAARINGYNPEAWATAPTFMEIAPRIAALFRKGGICIGQNIPFDRAFLEAEMERCGYRDPKTGKPFRFYHAVDTTTLAYAAWGLPGAIEKVKLTELTKFLGIPHADAHSAEGDVRACREVFYRALAELRGVRRS